MRSDEKFALGREDIGCELLNTVALFRGKQRFEPQRPVLGGVLNHAVRIYQKCADGHVLNPLPSCAPVRMISYRIIRIQAVPWHPPN